MKEVNGSKKKPTPTQVAYDEIQRQMEQMLMKDGVKGKTAKRIAKSIMELSKAMTIREVNIFRNMLVLRFTDKENSGKLIGIDGRKTCYFQDIYNIIETT